MLLGHLIFAAAQWLYLITVSSQRGVEAAGSYALCQAIIYPVFALCNLQLRRLQVTDTEQATPFSSYFSFALLSGGAAFIISNIIFAASGSRSEDASLLFVTLAAAKVIEALSDACYGNLQRNEHMRPIAFSLMLRNVLGYAGFVSLITAGYPIWQVAIAIPAGWVAVFLLHDIRHVPVSLTPTKPFGTLPTDLLAIFRAGLPLGGLIFFNQLFLSTPRIALEHYSGLAALGTFAPLASFITLGGLVVNAANSAALPRLSNMNHAGNRRSFVRLTAKLIAVAATLGFAGVLFVAVFGEHILGLVFDSPPPDANASFILIMIAATFWYMAGASGAALTAIRQFHVQMKISILVFALTGLFSIFAIPEYGVTAAAYALIVGAFIKLSMQVFIVSTTFRGGTS